VREFPYLLAPQWGVSRESVMTNNSATPEVLVLTANIGRQLHYDRIVPNGHTFWTVDSIAHARFIMTHTTTVKVVVVESETPSYHDVPASLEFIKSVQFIKWLRDLGYAGATIMVQRYVAGVNRWYFHELGWRVDQVDVFEFVRRGWEDLTRIFADTVPARDLLWVEWSRMLERSPWSNMHVLDEGPENVLTWLEEFEQTVRGGDARAIYKELIQMNVVTGHGDDCGCHEDASWGDKYKWMLWFHRNHRLYNRAVWEMLASVPGLLAAMRIELLDDMESTGFTPFGRNIRKSYGLRLWRFLQDASDPMWV
jgi:hypothetical protein